MKRYTTIIMILLMAATACQRRSLETDPSESTLPFIGLSMHGSDVQSAETRAMIYNSNLTTNGNGFKIYDLLSEVKDGSITYSDGSEWKDGDKWIDDGIEYDSANSAMLYWPYTSGYTHRWTQSGIHRFFGWFSYDAIDGIADSDLFGSELALDDANVLTTPSVTLTTASPQFDMMYSTITSRDASEGDHSAVQLYYYHLFSAISMSVQNAMSYPLTVNSIRIEGVENKAYATMDYSGNVLNGPTYNDKSADGYFFENQSLGKTLEAKNGSTTQIIDVFNGNLNPSSYQTALVWPQDQSVVSPTNKDALTGTYASTDSLIVINYTCEGSTYTKRVKFPSYGWAAGKKYHFNLKFTDKEILLYVQVLPWDYGEYEISYEENSIVAGQLSFLNYEIVKKNGEKTITYDAKKGNPIGHFFIMTPVGGTWTVGFEGDVNYFDIEPSSGTIDPSTNSGYVYFTIKPNLSLTRTDDKSITLKFGVICGDNEYDASSEITNGDTYRIILPAN